MQLDAPVNQLFQKIRFRIDIIDHVLSYILGNVVSDWPIRKRCEEVRSRILSLCSRSTRGTEVLHLIIVHQNGCPNQLDASVDPVIILLYVSNLLLSNLFT